MNYNKIPISDLKTGDQLFQKNGFQIKDPNTYLSWIILFGINFWNKILNRPTSPVHHCATIVIKENKTFAYEAKSKGAVFTPIEEKINNKNISILIIKRYSIIDQKKELIIKKKAIENEHIGYNFVSLFKQFFRQLFNEKISLERKEDKGSDKKNCSVLNGFLLESVGIEMGNIKNLDPEDLFFDKRSDIIGVLK